MKISKNVKHALLFAILIFFTAFIGQSTAHGYIHGADPFVLLGSVMLPTPLAMLVCGGVSCLVDLIKGYYLRAVVTLAIKLLMVLAVKGLMKTGAAKKFPELITAPAALIPVFGYYTAELINQLVTGAGLSAVLNATVTLRKDLLQAAGSILIFVLLYNICKLFKESLQLARQKEAEQKKQEEEPKE